MNVSDRLTRLERRAPDIDALIEAELARMTPDEQAAFVAQCAIDFVVDEQVELKKKGREKWQWMI